MIFWRNQKMKSARKEKGQPDPRWRGIGTTASWRYFNWGVNVRRDWFSLCSSISSGIDWREIITVHLFWGKWFSFWWEIEFFAYLEVQFHYVTESECRLSWKRERFHGELWPNDEVTVTWFRCDLGLGMIVIYLRKCSDLNKFGIITELTGRIL